MKSNINELLDAIIFDNKEFIKESEISESEYLIESAKEQGYHVYLTNEEIEDEKNYDNYANEVKEHIEEYCS